MQFFFHPRATLQVQISLSHLAAAEPQSEAIVIPKLQFSDFLQRNGKIIWQSFIGPGPPSEKKQVCVSVSFPRLSPDFFTPELDFYRSFFSVPEAFWLLYSVADRAVVIAQLNQGHGFDSCLLLFRDIPKPHSVRYLIWCPVSTF